MRLNFILVLVSAFTVPLALCKTICLTLDVAKPEAAHLRFTPAPVSIIKVVSRGIDNRTDIASNVALALALLRALSKDCSFSWIHLSISIKDQVLAPGFNL